MNNAPAQPAAPQQPPPPAAPPAVAASLQLSEPTIIPGGTVTATGTGCQPDLPVSLSVGDVPLGRTVAGPDGGFQAVLSPASIDVGRHQVSASCGRTLSAPLDVVLVSQVGTATAAMTLILIFLLTGVWFFGHRLISNLPPRKTSALA